MPNHSRQSIATARLRLPPEWHRQDGVLLVWPHTDTDWAEQLPAVEAVYLALAGEIARRERLLLVAAAPAAERRLLAILAEHGVPLDRVSTAIYRSDDTWARDLGPLTLAGADGHCRLLDFVFTGWGGKFPAERDNRLTAALHRSGCFGQTPLESLDWVLEGGAIEVNEDGCLLTTAACLLNPNRNPHLSANEIEARLREQLGVEAIFWLQSGHLVGDDTDSHVDTLCRFAPDHTICYVRCDDASDEHHADLARMEAELQALRTPAGQPFRLLPLPWPAPIFDDQGQRLPATYANFLVVNDAVLAPTYGDPQDEAALAVLRQAFPGRQVVGIDCRPLIRQHGSLHCVTMQLPAGTLARQTAGGQKTGEVGDECVLTS